MSKRRPFFAQTIANMSGLLGYASVLLQLLWVMIVFLPGILKSDIFKDIFLPQPAEVQPIHEQGALVSQSPLLVIGVGIVTIVMIMLTLYLLLKIPSVISKSGHTVTNEIANAAVPMITHNKKVSAKKRRALTFQLSFFVKFLFVVLLYTLIYIPSDTASSLDGGIIWAVGTVFAAGSLVWFCVQYSLTKLFSLPPENVL